MFVVGVSEGGEGRGGGRGELLGRCKDEGGEVDVDGDREVEAKPQFTVHSF